jgi:hypothetical protein
VRSTELRTSSYQIRHSGEIARFFAERLLFWLSWILHNQRDGTALESVTRDSLSVACAEYGAVIVSALDELD